MVRSRTMGMATTCHPWATAMLVAGALLCSAAAQAQQPLRLDPIQACDDLAQTLQRELAVAVQMLGRAGTAVVQFRWRGDTVVDVVAGGDVPEYRPALRRALRALHCPRAARGDRFELAVRFDPQADDEAEGAAPGRERFAAAGLPIRVARPDHGLGPR